MPTRLYLLPIVFVCLTCRLSAEVAVVAPDDGGWPRDAAKIVQTGANEFHVGADGHNRYLMVEIVNSGTTAQSVRLQGFIDDFRTTVQTVDGKTVKSTARDNYLYVCPPEGVWQRVYAKAGQGSGENSSDSSWLIEAPPGRTRVSTVVAFTYQEYADYIDSLPRNDRRVVCKVVATSGRGRFKTYRIRITNPDSRNRHKLRIALCKTSHAYEKAGFFIAQGAIAWLLSNDPAANLDHVEWSIYPCLDPQAAHDGCDYIEQAELVMDDGRTRGDARSHDGVLWDLQTGELPSQHYHVLTDVHMWEMRNYESYKYNDPFAPPRYAGNGESRVEADLLAFWPFWYEFGIDAYDHENKWPGPLPEGFDARRLSGRELRPSGQNARPEDFGSALVTHLELPFYGKDDIDPRDRLREQGRLWARSHSQAYLRMQRDRSFWTKQSAGGAVEVTGACFLPVPSITLIETLAPLSGADDPGRLRGRPMALFHEEYEHGIATTAGAELVYAVPDSANSFRAMAGIDDAEPDASAEVQFVAFADGKECWRSRLLRRGQRQMAYFGVAGAEKLSLQAAGPSGTLTDWGGARFMADDPELALDPTLSRR